MLSPAQFRRVVWDYHTRNGRHDLPWRKTTDPYRILVSEVMLQQTQVERVIPFYREWLKRFPTVRALAASPLGDVLKAWQGLGYNRRAKALWETAKVVVSDHKGTFPTTPEALEKLPGIGPYTARAVCAFAYNTDSIFIETNIRTVIIHHFFTTKTKSRNTTIYGSVSDKEILNVLEKVYPKGRASEWYAALMDYGSHLKRSGVRLNTKSTGYTKQSTFSGSSRQARGAILRALSKGPLPTKRLVMLLGDDREAQLVAQLGRLYNEGLIERVGATYRLPQ